MIERNTMARITGICIISIMLMHTRLAGQSQPVFMENRTPEWHEVIDMYRELDNKHDQARLIEAGETDAGKPLHLFIISPHERFSPKEVHTAGHRIIFINNGIHPGESSGIDASLAFAAELLSGGNLLDTTLENSVILIVPVLNVGGALNRSPYHRANQNGPEEHGFRGNAKNLDLNRDFVKMDSRNARSMARIIHSWDPDIFIDTHSTNGADYPGTLTLIPSHHQQLEEPQASFMRTVMEPTLYETMNLSPYKMTPYVNVFRKSPEHGFEGFYLYPRYLAGYTSTFHILSLTVETHMLKPYHERVLSTKMLLEEILKFTHTYDNAIRKNKEEAVAATIRKREHVLQWYNDSTQFDLIYFNGYRAKTRKSELTGQDMLWYDREDPWNEPIPYYNYFLPNVSTFAPDYYIVPAAWEEVILRLECSGIAMSELKQDTSLTVETYTIENFQTTEAPYNGHYMHHATDVSLDTAEIQFFSGDRLIPVAQRGGSYLVQALEPHGYDSFFTWNFFDAILSRKEYFSPYLFEQTAIKLLEDDKQLHQRFLDKKATEPGFAANGYAQLRWIYEHSPWSEPTYRRYPVYRYHGEISNGEISN
jgi:hypothetical protein